MKEPSTSDEAGEQFKAITGVDLSSDAGAQRAARHAVVGELLLGARRLDDWAKPLRVVFRRESEVPCLPKWVSAARERTNTQRGDIAHGESAEVAPGKKVELLELLDRAVAVVEDLRAALDAARAVVDDVEDLRRELETPQVDAMGRTGSLLEGRRNHRLDAAKQHFVARLQIEWENAGRPALEPADVARAAAYFRLDDLDGGFEDLRESWGALMRRREARER